MLDGWEKGSDVAGKGIEMGIKAVVGAGIGEGARVAANMAVKASDVCFISDLFRNNIIKIIIIIIIII